MLNEVKIDQNPASLFWEGNITEENLQIGKNTIRNFNMERKQIMPSSLLTKEHLETIKEHQWLKKCECVLVTKEKYPDLSSLVKELQEEAETLQEEVALKEPMKVLAIDLETTGLNQTIKFIGGKRETYNTIVGVCLATSKYKGYYIPVLHNETDKVENYKESEVRSFLQEIVNTFFLVAHNSPFDFEVLSLYGVKLNKVNFADTMLLAGHKGLKIKYRQVGLKFLSKTLLSRDMLEIGTIMGTKDLIRLYNIPASNAYVYGCSDAMNTLGLLYNMIEDDNPYQIQKNATVLDHKTVKHIRSMYRVGLPIHYEDAKKTAMTLYRRMLIVEEVLYKQIKDPSVEFTSPQQLGTYIFRILKRYFEQNYNNGEEVIEGSKGYQALCAKLQGDFSMTIKTTKLKSGITKTVALFPDDTVTGLLYNLHTWEFVPESERERIYIICEAISLHRSLAHEIGIIRRMVRFCYNDDFGIARCGIALKLNGADTTRFSNANSTGGSFDSITVVQGARKTKATFLQGNGVTGFNSQGVSNSPGKWKNLKKINIDKFPQELRDKLNKTTNLTENFLRSNILTNATDVGGE